MKRIWIASAALAVTAITLINPGALLDGAYRTAHAAPITVGPSVAMSSAVQAQARVQAARTPAFPPDTPQPRTVVGPSVRDGEYTYHTTYLYNPARVCTALIAKWQMAPSISCVLVP